MELQENGSDAFTPEMLRPEDRAAYLAVHDYFTGHGLDVSVHGSVLVGDARYSDIDLAVTGSPERLERAVSGLSDDVSSTGNRTLRPSTFERATGCEPHQLMPAQRTTYLGMRVDGDLGFRVGGLIFDVSIFNSP